MGEEELTVARFEERVGATFAVLDEDVPSLDLRLASVTDLTRPDLPTGHRTPFSLIFHGPLHPVLPQRTYRLLDEELGPREIFIVPVGPDGGAMQYEAIFT